MARFLVSTAPLPGHLDWGGLLNTASLLRQQGHEVLWCSGEQVFPLLAARGLDTQAVPYAFRPPERGFDPLPDPAEWYAFQIERTLDIWCDPADVQAAFGAHNRIIQQWQPDLVIADPLVYAAALAAEANQLPLIGCGFPGAYLVIEDFPATRAVTERWQTLRNQLRAYADLPRLPRQEPADLFFRSDDHLVFFPPAWFKHVNQRPAASVQYVGGLAKRPASSPPAWLAAIPSDRPVVTVTQTTGFGYGSELLSSVLEALEPLDCVAIIIGKGAQQPAASSAKIHWIDWVDYDHVLPRTSVLLHHGGMGTAHAAICHGVPQVITPLAADQYIHAERVLAYGAGLSLTPQQVNAHSLRASLQIVLEQPAYQQAATRLQQHFASFGGVARAARILVDYAHGDVGSTATQTMIVNGQ